MQSLKERTVNWLKSRTEGLKRPPWFRRDPVPQEAPGLPQPQPDILLALRATHEWESFEAFLEVFTAEQPENLPVLQQAFGRTLQASWISSHLLNPRQHANQPMARFDHLFFEDPFLRRAFQYREDLLPIVQLAPQRVDLLRDVVIVVPWKSEDTRKNLKEIGRSLNNPWQQDDNHEIHSYFYFGVFWCTHGWHSTMVGILKQEGVGHVTLTRDPTMLLKLVGVSADGKHYMKQESGDILGPVVSQEFAALFRIAQERLRLGMVGP